MGSPVLSETNTPFTYIATIAIIAIITERNSFTVYEQNCRIISDRAHPAIAVIQNMASFNAYISLLTEDCIQA